jgi:hypothetical protein
MVIMLSNDLAKSTGGLVPRSPDAYRQLDLPAEEVVDADHGVFGRVK